MDDYSFIPTWWSDEQDKLLQEMKTAYGGDVELPPPAPRCECGAAACGYTKPSRHHYDWCKFYAE